MGIAIAKEGAMSRYPLLFLFGLLPACNMAASVASVNDSTTTSETQSPQQVTPMVKIDPALRDALMRAESPPSNTKDQTDIASVVPPIAAAKNTPAAQSQTASVTIDPVQRLLAGIPENATPAIAKPETPREVMANIAQHLIEDPMARPDPELLANLETRDREWIELFARFLRELDPNDSEATARAARVLADRLDEHSALQIPTLLACGSVEDFGRYEPLLPADPVMLYRPNPTFVLYAELDRFQHVKAENAYTYGFEARIEVFDPKGRLLHEEDWFRLDDASRRPIRDFFVALPCQLPNDLLASEVTMKLRMRQGGAEAQRILPIRLTDDYDAISKPIRLEIETANVPS